MLRWLWRAVLALTVLILAGAGLASWRFAQYAPPDPPTAPDAQALARFIERVAAIELPEGGKSSESAPPNSQEETEL